MLQVGLHQPAAQVHRSREIDCADSPPRVQAEQEADLGAVEVADSRW
jgi:hypothetical protein